MRRKLIACLMPALLAMSSTLANAQAATEDETPTDARLVGYAPAVAGAPAGPIVIRPVAGAAGTWFVIAILGVMCFGVMCKNAKRSHLD